MSWRIGEDLREAIVFFPAKQSAAAPLVFIFHGHGGRPLHVIRHFQLHQLWPEAICVYPQGLPTAVPLIDPEGKHSGWQKSIGDQQDRDVLFFDAMLKTLQEDREIDPQRIYATGHSNGGFFSYVLWAARGDCLAAIAPVAGLDGLRDYQHQKPKAVMHVAGEKDPIVPYQLQLGTIHLVRKLNGCLSEGERLDEFQIRYSSGKGPPVVTYLHPGGHEVPAGAPEQIVRFMKQQTKR